MLKLQAAAFCRALHAVYPALRSTVHPWDVISGFPLQQRI